SRFGALASPLRLNLTSRGAEVALHRALFLLLHPFAEHFAKLRVHLSQIAVAEALAIVHVRAPVAVALERCVDAPLDVRGWTGLSPAEVLFVLDLQLADVSLKLAEIFVDCFSHGVWAASLLC